jgi:S-adenosylmethionine hydrolase
LHADRFGNLLTSLGNFSVQGKYMELNPWVGEINPTTFNPKDAQLEIGSGQTLPWAKTFADISPGECAVILGSSGLLEIAANRQSATNLLNLQPDEPVTLRFKQ